MTNDTFLNDQLAMADSMDDWAKGIPTAPGGNMFGNMQSLQRSLPGYMQVGEMMRARAGGRNSMQIRDDVQKERDRIREDEEFIQFSEALTRSDDKVQAASDFMAERPEMLANKTVKEAMAALVTSRAAPSKLGVEIAQDKLARETADRQYEIERTNRGKLVELAAQKIEFDLDNGLRANFGAKNKNILEISKGLSLLTDTDTITSDDAASLLDAFSQINADPRFEGFGEGLATFADALSNISTLEGSAATLGIGTPELSSYARKGLLFDENGQIRKEAKTEIRKIMISNGISSNQADEEIARQIGESLHVLQVISNSSAMKRKVKEAVSSEGGSLAKLINGLGKKDVDSSRNALALMMIQANRLLGAVQREAALTKQLATQARIDNAAGRLKLDEIYKNHNMKLAGDKFEFQKQVYAASQINGSREEKINAIQTIVAVRMAGASPASVYKAADDLLTEIEKDSPRQAIPGIAPATAPSTGSSTPAAGFSLPGSAVR